MAQRARRPTAGCEPRPTPLCLPARLGALGCAASEGAYSRDMGRGNSREGGGDSRAATGSRGAPRPPARPLPTLPPTAFRTVRRGRVEGGRTARDERGLHAKLRRKAREQHFTKS